MSRYMGMFLLAAMVALGLMALTMWAPAEEAEHLYHEGTPQEPQTGPLAVQGADAHWMARKWCKHRDGWIIDHHMHYRSQFWKSGRHYHKEAYHHFGTPNDHDRRNTRCPLHN